MNTMEGSNMKIRKAVIPAGRAWNALFAGNKSSAERNASHRRQADDTIYC